METTKLSSKGQVIIPKHVRQRHDWHAGQEFDVIETPEGVLLRPHRPFPSRSIAEVAGMLKKQQPALPVEHLNMEALSYAEPYTDSLGDDGR